MKDTFLYTLPQWFIFAGVFVVVYGWIEDKKAFRMIGSALFILLGIYSLIILLGDSFAAENFLTPDEIANEELSEEIIPEIPFQTLLLPAYICFLVSSVLAIPALIFETKNNRMYRYFIVASILVALLGFLIVVGVIKSV